MIKADFELSLSPYQPGRMYQNEKGLVKPLLVYYTSCTDALAFIAAKSSTKMATMVAVTGSCSNPITIFTASASDGLALRLLHTAPFLKTGA